MKQRLFYLVPPSVSHSSTANLQCLIEGLVDASRSNALKIDIEIVLLGDQHDALRDWAKQRDILSHEIPVRGSFDAGLWLRVRQFLMRHDPDLVHVWQGGSHLALWGFALLGSQSVLVDQTTPDCVLPGRTKPLASSLRPIVRRQLIARTKALVQRFDPAELMAAAGGFDESEPLATIRIIAPGVHIPEPIERDNTDSEKAIRESLGLPLQAKLIGMTSAFRRGGGGKDAIWSADLLKCVRDDTHVLLFGDGPLRWRLERFRWQTETEDRVHFVDESRLGEILPHLFCFWQPAHTAGGVQSLLSSMAHGVPVIASDLPTHRQMIKDVETGLLVTPGNRGSLARRTDLLLRDTRLRDRIAAAAREHALQFFKIDRQIKEYEALYAEVLSISSPWTDCA